MVKVVISVKALCIIGVLFAILLVAGGIYAFGGTVPSTMGHSIGELQPPTSCVGYLRYSAAVGWSCFSFVPSSSCSETNQVVQWTGSTWGCGIVNI